MAGRIKLIVRKDAEGEYVNYDKQRFAIHWSVPIAQAPSRQYPLLATKMPGYGYERDSLLLYRWPEGEEMLGRADAPIRPLTPGERWEEGEEDGSR